MRAGWALLRGARSWGLSISLTATVHLVNVRGRDPRQGLVGKPFVVTVAERSCRWISSSLFFSWLFWDISYPADRPEIFSRTLGDAENHTLSSPHLDHPLQEPQGRVGIHALQQKIPPKPSQGCSSKSRGSPRLRVLQIHCSPGAQKCHQDPVFLLPPSAPFSLLFSPISERLPPCSGQMAAFSPSLRPSQSKRIKTYRL